jgi:hypothetical protein
VAAAITFIYSFMVNTFQGCLAEILALPAILDIVNDLMSRSDLASNARVYAGDSVHIAAQLHGGRVKGADLHILGKHGGDWGDRDLTILGVVEVKSYARSWSRLQAQLSQHVVAAQRGLEVCGRYYGPNALQAVPNPVQIAVVPADWRLPRTFCFVEENGRKVLRLDPGIPPMEHHSIKPMAPRAWHVTLRWSKEALADAAYELTFWYLARVGEVAFGGGVPAGWGSMTTAEAGQNAAKMMLYYAILRARTWHEEQRAIALYNAYGFGYALGTSFKNPRGSREMLWFEDLQEILDRGENKDGCRLIP